MKVYSAKNINASANDPYTENLADFGYREYEKLKKILEAWFDGNGLPDDFDDSGVRPAFNRNSGYVFLTNDDYQVAIEVDGQLESFYTTPYEGFEGTYDELIEEADEDWNDEDLEYLKDLAVNRGDENAVDVLNDLISTVRSDE